MVRPPPPPHTHMHTDIYADIDIENSWDPLNTMEFYVLGILLSLSPSHLLSLPPSLPAPLTHSTCSVCRLVPDASCEEKKKELLCKRKCPVSVEKAWFSNTPTSMNGEPWQCNVLLSMYNVYNMYILGLVFGVIGGFITPAFSFILS